MTRDDAKILWPIIKAYSEGKTVQTSFHGTPWQEMIDPSFDDEAIHYRIKPEPVECWAVVDNEGVTLRLHRFESDAMCDAADCFDCHVIKLREVED